MKQENKILKDCSVTYVYNDNKLIIYTRNPQLNSIQFIIRSLEFIEKLLGK